MSIENLTFIIPIRVDTEDRIYNCETILRFIEKRFPLSEVILIEQDDFSKTDSLVKRFSQVRKIFTKNEGRFSKTRAMNLGITLASRPYICVYDTDVLIHPDAIFHALKILEAGIIRIVIPFNLIFADVSGNLRAEISRTLDLETYGKISSLNAMPRHEDLKVRVLNGGIMLACREIVALEGGYNKKMISYGWEDTEFFKRLNKLGYYSVMLSDYNLIHLDHRRGPDSRINEMYDRNRQEFEKVIAMSRRELRSYVENEIDIAEPEEKYRRSTLRKRQSIVNIFLAQKMYHLANKVRIYIQLYGLGFLFRRLAQQK